VMKPDHRIYEYALQQLGRQPEETVFIDDAARNVEGAREVGMYAIHYTSTVDVAAELSTLGVATTSLVSTYTPDTLSVITHHQKQT
jgi:FMN phosphatase YigB (HAD superfamily)